MGVWQSQYPKDKHFVVLGSGYAGSKFGEQLLKGKANFTIIDQRNFMHDNIHATRAAVIPGFVRKTIIPYGQRFGKHFKQDKAKHIDPTRRRVTFASGEEMQYDTLVIATGTTGSFPTKVENLSETETVYQYDDLSTQIKESTNIMVIGGGAAGVEMAAEVAAFYPEKKVTLVHGGTQILQYRHINQEFRKNISNILTAKLNIDMILGKRVTDSDAQEKEKKDLVIKCTGLKMNIDASSESLGDAMEPTGELRVNPYFQVIGYKNIYAIGDCCATGETKLAMVAQEHAKHLASNLIRHYQGKSMKPYRPNRYPVIMKISLGQKHEEILFRI